jgi:CcmD family protein
VSSGEKYVAAAYLVVFAVVLAWLLIMATKVTRLRREVDELEQKRGDG